MRRIRWMAASLSLGLCLLWLLSVEYPTSLQVNGHRLHFSGGRLIWHDFSNRFQWQFLSARIVLTRWPGPDWHWAPFQWKSEFCVVPGWLPFVASLVVTVPLVCLSGPERPLRRFPPWWCVSAVIGLVPLLAPPWTGELPLRGAHGVLRARSCNTVYQCAYLHGPWLDIQRDLGHPDWASVPSKWTWLEYSEWPTTGKSLQISGWLILLLLGWELAYRVSYLPAEGRCPTCNYTLLHCQDRCPECGYVASPAVGPATQPATTKCPNTDIGVRKTASVWSGDER